MVKNLRLFSPAGLFLTCLLLSLFKFWLIGPLDLVALNMPHDDLLFINQAENILQGNWLGPYNQFTLIKGPFYPIFIAVAHLLAIPLLTAQQLLYTFSCGIVVWALSAVIRQRWILLFLFLFLLFNPYSYNYPAIGRVLRLGIYQSLGMLTIGSMIGLYLRIGQSWKTTAGWAILTGLALSALWHTREESIWIVPFFVLMILALAYRSKVSQAFSFVHLLVALVVPAVIWAGFTAKLQHLNSRHYGISATIELKTPEFKLAYGGLLRIKTDKWRRYYPVVKDAREKAYEVSPTFALLKPYLEDEQVKQWTDLLHIHDMPANFFIWAFRDAVAASGYYQNSQQALDFYRKMGREIDAACAAGTLECRPRITSLMPPWHEEYNKRFFPTFVSIFKKIIKFQEFSVSVKDIMSKGSTELMQRFERVTRENLRTSRKDILLKDPKYHNHLNREKLRILNGIGSIYRSSVPLLFYGSFVIMLLVNTIPRARRRVFSFSVFYFSQLAGLCSIVFILTLVVVTSYPEIQRARHVSYPLVLLMIICMLLAISELASHSNRDPDNEFASS